MLKKVIILLVGFLCGVIFIKLTPFDLPIDMEKLLLIFVLNPIEFFIAAVVFIVGFIMNAITLEEGITQTSLFLRRKKGAFYGLILSVSLFISFFILFYLGFWQTLLFFSFSLLYGMISIDFSRFTIIKN